MVMVLFMSDAGGSTEGEPCTEYMSTITQWHSNSIFKLWFILFSRLYVFLNLYLISLCH